MIARWQHWILECQIVALPMPAAWKAAFVPSARQVNLDPQVFDFAGS